MPTPTHSKDGSTEQRKARHYHTVRGPALAPFVIGGDYTPKETTILDDKGNPLTVRFIPVSRQD